MPRNPAIPPRRFQCASHPRRLRERAAQLQAGCSLPRQGARRQPRIVRSAGQPRKCTAVPGTLRRSGRKLRQGSCGQPDYADAYCNRGNARQALGRHTAAIEDYDRAIALAPGLADAYANRGSALLALNKHLEAIENYSRAIAIRPDFAEAYSNRGYALQALERHHEAIADCDRAIAIKPGYAEAKWIKSHSLLCHGLSESAWQMCEQRLQTRKYGILRDYGLPLLGQKAPDGENLIVQWEQRFGDVIQMLRYVPLLEQLAGKCYWQIQKPLRELVTRSFPDIRQVEISECPGDVRYRVPFTSLPLVLRTFSEQAIPAQVPYLAADAQAASTWRRTVPGTAATARDRHRVEWKSGTAKSLGTYRMPATLAALAGHTRCLIAKGPARYRCRSATAMPRRRRAWRQAA